MLGTKVHKQNNNHSSLSRCHSKLQICTCKNKSKSIGLVTPDQKSSHQIFNPAHVIHPLLKKTKQTMVVGRCLPQIQHFIVFINTAK